MEQSAPYQFSGIGHAIRDIISQMGPWYEQNASNIPKALIGFAVSFIVFFIVFLLLRRILIPAVNRKFSLGTNDVLSFDLPLARIFLWFGIGISDDWFNFPTELDLFFDKVVELLIIWDVALTVLRFCRNAVFRRTEYLKQHRPETYSMNKLMLDLGLSIVRLVVWCYALFVILQNVFGVDVSHLLVGAGVVGMALAFAAQNTIANVFGAFSILGSRLFKVGDWIKCNGIEGNVEEIGFRSVRLRAFTGHAIDLPNRLIADSQVENFSDRNYWRENFSYGLVYQTSPEQIKKALQILDEIGRDLADIIVPDKPVKFSFTLCNSSSLDIEGYVWFNVKGFHDMRAARNRFNLEVVTRFNAAGLDFAYPTSTIFLEQGAVEKA